MTSGATNFTIAVLLALFALAGCEPNSPDVDGAGGANGAGGSAPATQLTVPVAGPTYVDLDSASVVGADADWDLRFDGLSVFTNGGESGPGKGKAFGPLAAESFAEDTVPAEVPFLFEDKPGGAFVDWYLYDPTSHLLYSRYHVFGVRRGEQLFKVQILSYYGEAQGAPVSALYQLRSAQLSKDGAKATIDWVDVDGTAGGAAPAEDAASSCLNLESGEVLLLTPEQAAESSAWDLCFRRATITVNGGDGGPGDVEAVDLEEAKSAGESIEELAAYPAAAALEAFSAVGTESLEDPSLTWKLDGIVSAFSDQWLTQDAPLAPTAATWLVAAADGDTPFFIVFDGLEGATASTFDAVNLRIKPIEGTLP